MPNERDRELTRLAIVNRHIEDADRHIAMHMARLEMLREQEADPTETASMLERLDGIRTEWQVQRDLILERIETLDKASEDPSLAYPASDSV